MMFFPLRFGHVTVVPVLFQQSLKESEDDPVVNLDHIFGVEPLKIASPSTDAEVALALRVLEGCCLLHRESTALAHQHKAIPVYPLDFSSSCAIPLLSCLFKIV